MVVLPDDTLAILSDQAGVYIVGDLRHPEGHLGQLVKTGHVEFVVLGDAGHVQGFLQVGA